MINVKKVNLVKHTHYVEIILNDDAHLNVLSKQLINELNTYLDEAEADENIKCVLLTAKGRAFCAGANLKEFDELSQDIKPGSNDDPIHKWQRLDAFTKPVVVCVQGFTLGGGFELVQMCDLVIASEEASFGQPEILLGTIPGGGGTQRLSRNMTHVQAFEMMVFGEQISAEMALSLGLINWVVPEGELEKEAEHIVAQLCDKPLHTLVALKALLKTTRNKELQNDLVCERKAFYDTFAHDDLHQSLKKFQKK